MANIQHLDTRDMNGLKLKCKKCGNVWVTKSKKTQSVTCSNRECKFKVNMVKCVVR